MEKFVPKLLVIACCASVPLLAAPVHANWVFQYSQTRGSLTPDSGNIVQGNGNSTPSVTPDFLSSTDGGSSPYSNTHGGWSQAEVSTFTWNGSGSPTALVSVTRNDTLTASASGVGGPPGGEGDSNANASVSPNESPAAHASTNGLALQTLTDSYDDSGLSNGLTTYLTSTTMDAEADGSCGGNYAYSGQGKVQIQWQTNN